MKNSILILLILLLAVTICNGQVIAIKSYSFGSYNTLIGKSAGIYLTSESLCVIIGSDSTAANIGGYDMIWYVNPTEEIEQAYPSVMQAIRAYDKNKDTKENRKKLSAQIAIAINLDQIIRKRTVKIL